MAKTTTSKQPIEPIAESKTEFIDQVDGASLNLEDAIADELLNDIDWQKVRAAIIRKAPAKLFAWLTSGNNTPINLSPFPELAALPSRDSDRERAA